MNRIKFQLAVCAMAASATVFAVESSKSAELLSISAKGDGLKQSANSMKGSDADAVKTTTRSLEFFKTDSAAKALGNASISYIGGGSSDDSSSGVSSASVARALDSVGLKYSKGSDGKFKVSWTIKGGPRTHMTVINAKSSNYCGVETRDVWAIGFSAETIDSNNLQALLELNATYKLGAWEVHKNDGKMFAIFTIRMPANASGAALRAASIYAAEVADDIELKATKGDAF